MTQAMPRPDSKSIKLVVLTRRHIAGLHFPPLDSTAKTQTPFIRAVVGELNLLSAAG